MWGRLWHDEEGLATVEYALLLALVSLAAIAAWQALGQRVSSTVSSVASHMPGQQP